MAGSLYIREDNDRLILDARPPNRKEVGLVFWVRLLVGPGSLVDCVLESNEVLAQYAEDAVDYYNRWLVTVERAVRNSLAIELKVSDVKHLRACPDLPDGAFVVPAVSALAMGDLQAVELGQLGHLTIAVRAAAVNNHTVLCRERPFPRSAYFAGVCIDDFCAFEKEEGDIVDGVVVPAACAPAT
ncbi:unnamed protein product, partial [Polarella glacialis]